MCATTSKPSEFCVIIPARLASSRLPNKPLLEIAGKPMIYHTWHQAQQAGAQRVIVQRITLVLKRLWKLLEEKYV